MVSLLGRFALVMVGSCLAFALACGGARDAGEPRSFRLTVEAGRSQDGESVLVSASLVETKSGALISRPRVLASWNEPASIEQQTGDERFTLTVDADRATGTCSYSVDYSRAGEVLYTESGTVPVPG